MKRYDRAVQCLKWVAKFNGRKVEDSIFNDYIKHHGEKMNVKQKVDTQEDTFMGMFKTPRLRRFTLTLLLKS